MTLADLLPSIETLSHAYAIEGAQDARDSLLAHLAAIGFSHEGHPDAYVRTYESFGIGESREVAQRAAVKPLVAPRGIIVLTAPSLTAEAQNALLKTFEEPAAPVTFFLITPSFDALLPTLRSRLALLPLPASAASDLPLAPAAFLKASPAARLKLLEPLLKERRIGEVIAFLIGLEQELAPRIAKRDAREGLEAVYRARSYALDKGALLKPLLEQVALLAPPA
ncbi:MAG TPA: hypothetical protein VFL98_01010 [Candidatus Paceibacterota bacterium]|nr:hypothetical protein [Candidatus Paceibacterota bacterium]